MINTILLYDNQDATLGAFFNLCANKFLLLNNTIFQKIVCKEHNTKNCKKETIESVLSDCNSSKFLFVCFLHGNEEAMYVDKTKIVSSDNAYFFSNAFCYTFSCNCGKKLAHILLENKALVFWGYIDKVYSIADYEDDFADLSVMGLKFFLSNETVESSYNKVKDEFTEKIDLLYESNYFVASTLLHNRDSMFVCGDKSLTINDF